MSTTWECWIQRRIRRVRRVVTHKLPPPSPFDQDLTNHSAHRNFRNSIKATALPKKPLPYPSHPSYLTTPSTCSEEVRSSVWESCYKSSACWRGKLKPPQSRFGIGSVGAVRETDIRKFLYLSSPYHQKPASSLQLLSGRSQIRILPGGPIPIDSWTYRDCTCRFYGWDRRPLVGGWIRLPRSSLLISLTSFSAWQ